MQYFIDRETLSELSDGEFRRTVSSRASLGNPIAVDAAFALGYDLVELADPPAFDAATRKLVRAALKPADGGGFAQGWEPVLLTVEELDAKAAEYAVQLELLRAKKVADINQARVRADASYFTFADKQIDVDESSMRQILAITGYVALFGTYPPVFPGAWKTMDNSYLALPDVDTWKALIQAMTTQGTENFLKQQALKAEIAKAASMAAVEAIGW